MYPDYPYFAVAITRTCGSGGGSYIGKQLAKAFDIDLYDRKLLRLASEDSGISEELFARADENTRKTMLYRVSERVYDGSIIPPESGNFISDENLFNYQAKVLRELLNEESYICVGRAADFVFMDRAQHTAGATLLESVQLGDIPGIGMVMIDGLVRCGRSRNTPPATEIPVVL